MAHYFDPSGFLEVAKELLQVNPDTQTRFNIDEANVRTAINRAYFTAFLKIAETRGFDTHQKEAHKKLHSELDDDYGMKRDKRKLINYLDQIRQLRVKSDYSTDYELTYTEGIKAVKISDLLLDNVHKLKVK